MLWRTRGSAAAAALVAAASLLLIRGMAPDKKPLEDGPPGSSRTHARQHKQAEDGQDEQGTHPTGVSLGRGDSLPRAPISEDAQRGQHKALRRDQHGASVPSEEYAGGSATVEVHFEHRIWQAAARKHQQGPFGGPPVRFDVCASAALAPALPFGASQSVRTLLYLANSGRQGPPSDLQGPPILAGAQLAVTGASGSASAGLLKHFLGFPWLLGPDSFLTAFFVGAHDFALWLYDAQPDCCGLFARAHKATGGPDTDGRGLRRVGSRGFPGALASAAAECPQCLDTLVLEASEAPPMLRAFFFCVPVCFAAATGCCLDELLPKGGGEEGVSLARSAGEEELAGDLKAGCAATRSQKTAKAAAQGVSEKKAFTPPPLARIDACSHCFHLRCIQVWAQRETSCPLCKAVFSYIAAYNGTTRELLDVVRLLVIVRSSA
ncbi:hypothetical protein cyc_04237 [Cyclospora cayetanensis]|uniref:RING-type domain-containing protein n=1 Tax=Cyclospora cayetanensis TaxID=88456 RepID=A0A1D3D850_9EIME|nr:hypothetical protein cyc_04237 [Cyclospora cayetanensis]